MRRAGRLAGVSERLEPLDDDRLKIRLARVDHVVDPFGASEARVIGAPGAAAAGPDLVSVRLTPKDVVLEIGGEQAEFPELIGDVLADVGHRAVAAHDDLFALLQVFEAGTLERHHPATLTLAALQERDRPALLQELERRLPEAAAEDVSFPGEQVVPDPETRHGVEVAMNDPPRDVRRHLRVGMVPFLEVLQDDRPERQHRGGGGIHLGHPGIEIPAVVIEAAAQGPYLLEALALDFPESD